MFGAILAGAGISAVGGLLGAKGAKDAANIQAEAAREATAEQRRQYDISRSDFGRWREAGSESVGRLRTLLGLSGAPATEGYGSLNRRFTMDDFEADPVNQLGLQFGLDEGSKAIRRMFGAQGMGRSGAAAKGLTRFATDYAGFRIRTSRSTVWLVCQGLGKPPPRTRLVWGRKPPRTSVATSLEQGMLEALLRLLGRMLMQLRSGK
jgi:hypothetical protein